MPVSVGAEAGTGGDASGSGKQYPAAPSLFRRKFAERVPKLYALTVVSTETENTYRSRSNYRSDYPGAGIPLPRDLLAAPG